MNISAEFLDKIERKAKEATQGEWWCNSETQTDTPDRHFEYVIFDDAGHVICDTRNSDGGLIEIDFDDDDFSHARNETSRRNAEYIVRMDPPTTLALVDAHRAALARVAKLESQLEIDHCFDVNGERQEIPSAERDRFPDGIECRDATIGLLEDRIRELEARAWTIPAGWKLVPIEPSYGTATARAADHG